MAGSFVTSAVLRGLFWGIDGIALVLAGSLLTLYYFRKGADGTAAGFLIFSIGQALILSSSGIDLSAGRPLFAAGTGLWSTALFVVSAQRAGHLLGRRRRSRLAPRHRLSGSCLICHSSHPAFRRGFDPCTDPASPLLCLSISGDHPFRLGLDFGQEKGLFRWIIKDVY